MKHVLPTATAKTGVHPLGSPFRARNQIELQEQTMSSGGQAL